jgi:formylglycine-generating enzyme required for sulfatase activity
MRNVLLVFILLFGSIVSAEWDSTFDFDNDGVIGLGDFVIFAAHWGEIDPELLEPDITWISVNDPGVSGHEAFNGYMSQYETTNEQYCKFLNQALAAGDIRVSNETVYGNSGQYINKIYCEMMSDPGNYKYPTIQYSNGEFTPRFSGSVDLSDHPVVHVSYYGAMAFCDYYGYRIPTQWEWQAVADYDGSYVYATGATISEAISNYSYANPLSLTSYPHTSPVGYYNPYGYGFYDMAGNAAEWTITENGTYADVYGGHWKSAAASCVISHSSGGSIGYLNDTAAHIGFRVCRDN